MRIINRNLLIILIVFLIFFTAGLGGYFLLKTGYQTPSPSAQPTVPSEQTPTIPETNKIIAQNFAFNPAAVKVKVGTSVSWTNEDSVPHQIGSEPDRKLFQSQPLSHSETYTFTFNKPGEYNYFCLIHTSMKGKVIVEE